MSPNLLLTLALLHCLVLPGGLAADLADREPDEEPSPYFTSARTAAPAPVNRASQLVGMSVVNGIGESLGRIAELVLEFETGRVAYVALESGGKRIVLPWSLFHQNAAGTGLLLHADPDRLANAAGFTGEAWPAARIIQWGAEAPLSPLDRDLHRQVPPLGEVHRSPSGLDRDPLRWQQRLETERYEREQIRRELDRAYDRRRFQEMERMPGWTGPGLVPRALPTLPAPCSFHGQVTAIDLEERLITVAGSAGTLRFLVDDSTVFGAGEFRSLEDLRNGQGVAVFFAGAGDTFYLALSISALAPERR